MTGVTRPSSIATATAEVDVAVLDDGVAVEGGVDFRLAQRGDDRAFEDEIVDCDFRRVVLFAAGFELGANAHERRRH